MIGQTLAHYKITGLLGKGGMGEVYRAEDSKLHREVAIKVLPEKMASDPERLERFQREARSVAALNHPRIVTIHSVEEVDGVHLLTMEVVEGRSLDKLLPGAGFDLEELFDLSVQIADGLAAAHEKGITHRDLKPGNVMVTQEGRVKILDFGLAKLAHSGLASEVSQLPTEAMTHAGLVVGTAPYMSPEQIEGAAIDHRTDIFSLGTMLHEMATGQRPFKGDSSPALMSSILRDVPQPVNELKGELPRHLGRIIRRCLEKNPDRRIQSAKDVRNELRDLRNEVASAVVEEVRPGATVGARPRTKTLVGLGFAVLAILMVSIWRLGGDSKPAAREAPPSWRSTRLTSLPGIQSEPSLSPDGQRFLFVDYSSPAADVYEQRVGGSRASNLTAGSGAADYQPAYSPDGQRIAFRSERDGGGLYVMEATGENVRKIVDEGFMPSWSPGGDRIAYCTVGFTLPTRGGRAGWDLRIVDLDTGAIETLERPGYQPGWSPGGERIAFMGYPTPGQRDIGTIPVEGGEPVWVTNDAALDWSPRWSPDGRFLYFASNRGGAHNIWRVAIDQETGEVLGDFQDVTRGGTELQGFLSIAADGRSLVYAGRQDISNLMAAPYDRKTARVSGSPVAVTVGPRSIQVFDISPDGERIAFMRGSPWEDIALMRVDGSDERKLTDDPHMDRRPRFSPDGEQIYFYSNRDGSSQVWSIRPDGTGRTPITAGDAGFMFSDPSPDGRTMSTNTREGSELFSLTEPYSAQTSWQFPRDSRGRIFAPVDWSSDGRRILGSLHTPGASDWVTAIYDLDSEAYERAPAGVGDDAFLGDDHRLVWARGNKVMAHDLRTAETRELLSTAPDDTRWPMLSPDGKILYFLRQSASSDIHMLELEDPN